MEFLGTLGTGAIGGLLAATVYEGIKLYLKRKHDQQSLCAVGLVDVASSMKALRDLYEQLETVKEPAEQKDLVKYPSDFSVRPPAIALARYVEVIDDHRAARHAILMFDALDALTRYSVEHRAAYTWLLERDDWTGTAFDEKRYCLNYYRIKSRFQVARALCCGHDLYADLCSLATSAGNARQYAEGEFRLSKARAEALAEEFGKRAEEIGASLRELVAQPQPAPQSPAP